MQLCRRAFWTLIALFVCGEDHATKLKNRMTHVKRSTQLSIPSSSPTFSAEVVCKLWPDFTPEQRNYCMKKPRVASAIATGIHIGLRECESQFQYYRWNCTTSFSEMPSFGQNRAVPGTKEAAFMNAIVAAGVAYSVTAACARNNITDCVCTESKGRRTTTQNGWEKEGCPNNIAHGIKVSKNFLDGPHGPAKTRYDLQVRHNREVGRQAVRKIVNVDCKCLGASGACTSMICYKTHSSSFERVGNFLKNKYNNAMLVTTKDSTRRDGRLPTALVVNDLTYQKPAKDKLVYLDKSPTYCDPDSEKGIAGTRGRICDQRSNHSHGCRKLCCGRGYDKFVIATENQCKCKFHWCCEVKCKICKTNKLKTVCK